MDAAVTVGAADFCNRQLYDPRAGMLRMEGHHGFTDEFLTFFATVGGPSVTGRSCASALTSREAGFVNDVTHSPIFVGQRSLEVVRAAGCRAAHSYPLLSASDEVSGVLSFHHRKAGPPRGRPGLVASGAAQALTLLNSR